MTRSFLPRCCAGKVVCFSRYAHQVKKRTRSIHALFETMMAEKAHGYCVPISMVYLPINAEPGFTNVAASKGRHNSYQEIVNIGRKCFTFADAVAHCL
jgi:hypothetical protein